MKTAVQLKSGLIIETDEPSIWPEGKRLSRAEGKRLLREQAAADLRRDLPDGGTVWGIILSVSASGMSRKARFYAIRDSRGFHPPEAPVPLNITGNIAQLLGWPHDGGDWIRLDGCGMDMLWHTVESVKFALGYTSLESRRL